MDEVMGDPLDPLDVEMLGTDAFTILIWRCTDSILFQVLVCDKPKNAQNYGLINIKGEVGRKVSFR
jgi:hypothetical protein